MEHKVTGIAKIILKKNKAGNINIYLGYNHIKL